MLKTVSGFALAIVALAASGCVYAPAEPAYASYQPYAYSGVSAGTSQHSPTCGAAHDCRSNVGAPYAIQDNAQ